MKKWRLHKGISVFLILCGVLVGARLLWEKEYKDPNRFLDCYLEIMASSITYGEKSTKAQAIRTNLYKRYDVTQQEMDEWLAEFSKDYRKWEKLNEKVDERIKHLTEDKKKKADQQKAKKGGKNDKK